MRRQRRRAWVLIGAALLVGAAPVFAWELLGASNRLRLPIVIQRDPGLPLPPADEASQRLSVPPGFAIRSFRNTISGRPRFMAFGPDAALYVSLMSAGSIARLTDQNRDGLAEEPEIVAAGLSGPHGIEWRDGWLYVAEGDKVERLRDADGNGTLERRELVTDNIPGPLGHSSRTLHFGPDGKLYVTAGSSCNDCVEDDPRRAAMLRFNADGSIPADNPFANDADEKRRPLWAWGLRNSVDFLWTPGGALWADHNGSDGRGDDVPPEEIVIPVQRGMSHGWPNCYTAGVGAIPAGTPETPDPIKNPTGSISCAGAVAALFTAPAHSAPLGMTLGAGTNFPPTMRADLFVAYHGSWNTNNVANYRDCKVERVVVQNGVPVSAQPFVTGFRTPGQKCGSAWGRPADVVFGPDGAMYISDDAGGRIYRVVYTGE